MKVADDVAVVAKEREQLVQEQQKVSEELKIKICQRNQNSNKLID